VSERIFVVGAGKVGRGLALAFRSAHLDVLGVHGRTPRDGATTSGTFPATLAEANVVVVAVSDPALDEVLAQLAAARTAQRLAHGAVVLYTSGGTTPRALDALRAAGVPCGTFHPLAPFPTPERGAAALHDGWVGIDGDATACATARRLAAAVGARTVNIPAGAKTAYHAAAVFASNFPIVLAAIATRLLAQRGFEEHTAQQVVAQLMRAAVENLAAGAPAQVLTGPAARGDEGVITSHRDALRVDPVAAEVYDALTRAAREMRP
jgi:predicted short-subunit dehydrogenase-like oxidoreductase (DUF2520 family)